MRNPNSLATPKTTPCCSKVGIKRGPWTPEEDELLANYINREGEGRWRTLPKRAGLQRCGKSCRLRWMNYLRPSVKRGRIAPDEEDLILRLHRLLGNRWSLIAGRIPGRTDNEIKNYWNTHLSKKLISQGIDPRTHKPLENLVNPSSNSDSIPASNKNPSNLRNSDSNIYESEPITTTTPPQENFPKPNLQHDNNPQCQINHFQVAEKTAGNWSGSADGFTREVASSSNVQGNVGGDFMDTCNEDVFSSFLDSLINENAIFANQHHNNQIANGAIGAPPTHSFNPNVWEAEGMP